MSLRAKRGKRNRITTLYNGNSFSSAGKYLGAKAPIRPESGQNELDAMHAPLYPFVVSVGSLRKQAHYYVCCVCLLSSK